MTSKVTKQSKIVPEMRERLLTNRSGKLTSSQWLDMVIQPLTSILVFLMPLSIFILPRFFVLLTRGFWIFLLLMVAAIAVTIFRAYRYARAPVHFGTFHARTGPPTFWMFWRPVILHTEDGEAVRFGKRLSPRPIVRRDRAYIAYYLKEPGDNVLLSIAPADHPDVDKWQPDRAFETRFKQRGGG